MKVRFANAEVDVWKLRKGVVLHHNQCYLHLTGFHIYKGVTTVCTENVNGCKEDFDSHDLEWLEPH